MQGSKHVKGKITISRVADSTRDSDFMSITIKDKESGKELMEAQMELEEFALAITGGGRLDARLRILMDNIPFAGFRKEITTVKLPYYSTSTEIFRESQQKEARKYEVDGWRLVPEDYNHHRASHGFYHATFERYTEVK